MNDDSFERLAEKLAALSERRRRATESEDSREIQEMFADCQVAGAMTREKRGPDERHRFDLDVEDLGPLPRDKAVGKRYCRTCGTHKRVASFDTDSDRCRACAGGPSTSRSRAA